MTDVSIIIPVHNGETWINSCMSTITEQINILNKNGVILEIVVFNDGSTDNTEELLNHWRLKFEEYGISFIVIRGLSCKGVGAAKNVAVSSSNGEYLCFQDIDDTMRHDRIWQQYNVAQRNRNAIIGSRIERSPPDSTPRLVHWANSLTPSQLKVQIYTSNGPTVLMPTWFCHRSVYDKVGGFVETGRGTPEDLIFFYAHLDLGGNVLRVDEELVIYTYHRGAATFSVQRETIWNIQIERLEKQVLSMWESFIVWNAGKAGRKFVRSLNEVNQHKVKAFCDVDVNKIGRTIELYSPKKRSADIKLPVIHFSEAKPPLIICMKLDLTDGQFEANLKSMNLIEGHDYILFN